MLLNICSYICLVYLSVFILLNIICRKICQTSIYLPSFAVPFTLVLFFFLQALRAPWDLPLPLPIMEFLFSVPNFLPEQLLFPTVASLISSNRRLPQPTAIFTDYMCHISQELLYLFSIIQRLLDELFLNCGVGWWENFWRFPEFSFRPPSILIGNKDISDLKLRIKLFLTYFYLTNDKQILDSSLYLSLHSTFSKDSSSNALIMSFLNKSAWIIDPNDTRFSVTLTHCMQMH